MSRPSSSSPSSSPLEPAPPAPSPVLLAAAPAIEQATGGIPDSGLSGPFAVGEYAAALRSKLRSFARVQIVGELVNLRPSRARVYFELRDATGAISCAAWRRDWDVMVARAGGPPAEGMQVVVAGGCDYYPGSATSSPGFSFAVSDLRVAGEGDLLARIERLRKQLDAEGLFEPQKQLPLALLPRTIGVITGQEGKARDDVLAALARRGWAGRLVWGFAPVQDRHAAPAIVRALGDLAAVAHVDIVIVARGGGSLADLLCFCDETLCRTVALLNVPVIASVGHHTDRTLLDDVAAVSCSTPTHAAEAAVGVDCRRARADQAAVASRLCEHGRRAVLAREQLPADASRLRKHGRRAVLSRARMLSTLTRAPAVHLERERAHLHQRLREVRAGSRRRIEGERGLIERRALVLGRKADSSLLDCRRRRPQELQRLALALAGHDPQRTLERGYALVESHDEQPLLTAAQAREAEDVRLRFADGVVPARIQKQ
jgi:exodeoxyribonuclease VII large subunit